MPGALQGITVLDASQDIAGPYCTKLLACLGADVIKVEAPQSGDSSRRLGPFVGDDPSIEKSIPFLYLNTSKKGITLNLEHPDGADLLRRLAAHCDVLVESLDSELRERGGLTYEHFARVNPRLVVTSISHFGLTGPWSKYKGTEIVDQALSGHMQITGEPDREPLQVGGNLAQYTCGQTAFTGTMMAVFSAMVSGQGQLVDVSVLEAFTDILDGEAIQVLTGRPRRRQGNVSPGAILRARGGLFQCKDGWVALGQGPGGWDAFAEMIGEDLLDPRFRDPVARTTRKDEIEAAVESWLMEHGKVEVYEFQQARRNVTGYVALPEDLLSSRHLQARGYFREVDHPVVGRAPYAGAPFRIVRQAEDEGSDWLLEPAPLLGQHNAEVYGRLLGLSAPDLAAMYQQGLI